MMRKLPWVLLVLSIMFNFFFAGGFLTARSESTRVDSSPEARQDLLASKLNLTDDQKKEFRSLREGLRSQVTEIRKAVVASRQELWSQIANGTISPDRIREIMDHEADQAHQIRILTADHIRTFMSKLTSDQRERLLELMRNHEINAPEGEWASRRPGQGGPGTGPARRPEMGPTSFPVGSGRAADAARRRFGPAMLMERYKMMTDEEKAAFRKALETFRANSQGGPPAASPPSPGGP